MTCPPTLDADYLSLGAIAWAACGKDAGYTPQLLLDLANRHSCFRASDLKAEHLARPVDLTELKRRWLTALASAVNLFGQLPPEELGCLYVNAQGQPMTPDTRQAGFAELQRHFGSVRGAWPRIAPLAP